MQLWKNGVTEMYFKVSDFLCLGLLSVTSQMLEKSTKCAKRRTHMTIRLNLFSQELKVLPSRHNIHLKLILREKESGRAPLAKC